MIYQPRATPWVEMGRKDQLWKGVTSKRSVPQRPFVVGNTVLPWWIAQPRTCRILPSLLFVTPFQGWILTVNETQGVALGWFVRPLRGHEQATRSFERNEVLVHLCTNTDNIRQKLFFAANERESTQIGRNRFGIIDASWIHLRVFALICGKRFLSRIKLNTARSMLPEIESTCTSTQFQNMVVVIFEVIPSQQSVIIRYYIGVWRVLNKSHAF